MSSLIQGISYWNGLYELALRDKDMQVRFGLKMVLECWDREFFGTTTIFQKSNIGWPQQPLTEKVLKFNMKFHDSNKTKIISKHQNKAEFKTLDDSEVFSCDFSDVTFFEKWFWHPKIAYLSIPEPSSNQI